MPALPLSLQSIPLIPASVAVAGSTALRVSPSTSGGALPLLTAGTSSWAGQGLTSAPKPKTPPFRMATSIVPIPGKLVKRIQALEYIDMRELLPDNIALAERLATLPQGLTPPKPPSEREIGGDRALLTWVSSFATYIAIVAEAHPGRVGDMLAYMRLLIREAGKFGGSGWLTYDSVYRRNQEGSSTPWNTLDASLHQVFIASQGDRITVPCKHCQELDHSPTECAVAAVLPGTTASTPALPSSTVMNPERPSTKGKRPIPYTRQRPICSSWNAGNCKFPGKCTYAHVCINCYGSHPASACREKLYAGPPPAPKQPLPPARRD